MVYALIVFMGVMCKNKLEVTTGSLRRARALAHTYTQGRKERWSVAHDQTRLMCTISRHFVPCTLDTPRM